MRFVPDFETGPHDTADAAWQELRKAGSPLVDLTDVEELFRYDGTRIAIVRTQRGDILLENVVDEGERAKGGETVETARITHYLHFDDADTIRATLNTEFVPTAATYAAATGPVVREVMRHRHGPDGRDSFRLSVSSVRVEDVAEDEMPYRHLRPGRTSVHGPFEDPLSDETFAAIEVRLLPSDEDEVIGFHDCARAWVVRRPNHINPVSLVFCVADDAQGWVQHRLHFADEKAIEETLVTFAPTMDTYRRATSAQREVIGPRTPAGSWIIVQSIRPEDLATEGLKSEAPAYEDVAAHDAAWPQFAGKRNGGGGAPQGEGK